MSLKEQLLAALEQGGRDQCAFMDGLPEAERSAAGTYEQWRAKDGLAHIAYWQEHRAIALEAMAQGKEPPRAAANVEAANAACFERFGNRAWDEVRAYAEQALTRLTNAVRALDDTVLGAPPPSGGERPLWQELTGTSYTHPLAHLAEFYSTHGATARAGQLWLEWGRRVAPLDDAGDWQGYVHYNVACGLALSGNPKPAIAELREALRLRPSLTSWSRQDSDLTTLHGLPEFRELYAPAYWWKAIAASPTSEALADQFVRALGMLRRAIQACPEAEWCKGDHACERPAALALHMLASAHNYGSLKPGDTDRSARFVDWEEKDATRLPSQAELLAYQDEVEQRIARFLTEADLGAPETQFRWVGSTLLSRAIYSVRHTQHHVGELCLELHRRGLPAPQWE